MKGKTTLRSLRSSLYDTCNDYLELVQAMCRDLEVSLAEFEGMGVVLKSIIIQLKAIKEILCQRKKAITDNGFIYSCFKFPSLIGISLTKSDLEKLEKSIAMFAQEYMDLGRRLQREFASDANRCFQEEAKKSNVLDGSVYEKAVNNAAKAVEKLQEKVQIYEEKIKVSEMKMDLCQKKLDDIHKIINGF